MTNQTYDYVVIGAGAAGLSFAALMEKKGHSVALLEAHFHPGGCSSYFERDGFTFDAGATTLSGFKKGRPLEQLFSALNLKLELTQVNPGIVSILKTKTVNRYQSFEDWIKELNRSFPEYDNAGLWNELQKIEQSGWGLTSTFKNIPLRSLKSTTSFFNPKIFGAIKTIPSLFASVSSLLKKYKINDPEYLAMIDEMLFITTQNTLKDSPLLMGAMGLCYPEDTTYAHGGMKAFSEKLASACSQIFYRHKVEKIIPGDVFKTVTNKGVFHSKKVISTIPIWNHEALFDDMTIKNFYSNYPAPDPKDCWSAFMIYLTIPVDPKRDGQYFQIHTDDIPYAGTHSFFVSLSHPHDESRSINGRQTVTISTHVKTENWLGLDVEEYKKKKQECADYILAVLASKFKLDKSDLQNILTATPKTFIKYTSRHNGLVGGIPHSIKRSPLDFLIARSPLKNFYMLGDTQFPGQGIAAVVLGAQNLSEYLESN